MFQPGDVVDNRYHIVGPLGQGGMAHVFEAHDRHLDRTVALKVLRPHLTEADSERFRREIRTLARLCHPGIVTIYDLGLGDTVYFAMEMIEGGPITDLGPYEADPELSERLLKASKTVAEALGYVHNLGIVHRDLTPRNILVTNQYHPKVMDFGLVQLTETSQQLTRTGFTLGTPHYMAPEQATGEPTGAATDLYAFGAVLYRTLTGVAPFEADNDQAVLYQHVYGDATPPIELNPLVPRALSDLVMQLMSKEPGRRPLSGYAVADNLRSMLANTRSASTHTPLAGPGRTGTYTLGPVSNGDFELRWQRKLDQGPQWPAGLAYAAGFVFVGLRSDALAVLHPADGTLHATFETADEVSTPPLFSHDRLYITSRDGSAQALSWPEGRQLWHDHQRDIVGMVAFGDGLLLSTRQGTVEYTDTELEQHWRFAADAPFATPPVVQQNTVFAVTTAGWLHALDALSGSSRFRVDIGIVAAAPSAQGTLLLLPERSGALHAFDVERHEVLWSYDLDGELWSAPTIWSQRLYVASWGQTLHCLSLRTGDDLWTQPLPGPTTATAVVAAGRVYVGTEGGDLLAFDARSGRLLAKTKAGHGAVQASPLPVDDGLVVATVDGTVALYG